MPARATDAARFTALLVIVKTVGKRYQNKPRHWVLGDINTQPVPKPRFSMFYGSEERKTAIAEIDDNPTLSISVGTFRTTRDAAILDLTQLPRRLGFFEQQPDSRSVDRYAVDFLHSFVESLAAKVEPGEREHVDYVPTQVVTEWFRTAFRHHDSQLDGIRYPSTQRPGGTLWSYLRTDMMFF